MSNQTKLSAKIFLALFLLFSLANLLSLATVSHLDNYLTKPFLMIWLAGYAFCLQKKPLSVSGKWLMFGLFFSFLGDTFLLLASSQPGSENFFLLGLGSFLITHIAYWLAFHKWPQMGTGLVKKRPWIILPFAIFWSTMIYWLWPNLPADLKVPVIVYSLVIMLMAIKAVHISPNLSEKNQRWLISGALLFVLSDSIIAFSRFTDYLPTDSLATGLAIMITYLSGQLLIVWGVGRA